MSKPGKKADVAKMLFRLMYLRQKLEGVKKLYEEVDDLTLKIMSSKKVPKTLELNGKKIDVAVVDNFAEKNVVWRAAGVRRWDIRFGRYE